MEENGREALDFLAAHHVVALALSDGTVPHACSLMYAHAGFTLFWLSDPETRHSRLIDGAGQVAAAATIAPDYDDFRAIRGLQIAGTASRVAGLGESARALAALAGRYAFLAGAGTSRTLAAAMAKAKVYRLVAETVTFIDNTRSFGSKTVLRPGDFA